MFSDWLDTNIFNNVKDLLDNGTAIFSGAC